MGEPLALQRGYFAHRATISPPLALSSIPSAKRPQIGLFPFSPFQPPFSPSSVPFQSTISPFQPKIPYFQSFLGALWSHPRNFRDQFCEFPKFSWLGESCAENMGRILEGVNGPPPSLHGGGGLFSSFRGLFSSRFLGGVGLFLASFPPSSRLPVGIFTPNFYPLPFLFSACPLSCRSCPLFFALWYFLGVGGGFGRLGGFGALCGLLLYYVRGVSTWKGEKANFCPCSFFVLPSSRPSVSLVRFVPLVSDCIRTDRPYLLGGLFVVFGFSLPNT